MELTAVAISVTGVKSKRIIIVFNNEDLKFPLVYDFFMIKNNYIVYDAGYGKSKVCFFCELIGDNGYVDFSNIGK